jgi:hypothetical protein
VAVAALVAALGATLGGATPAAPAPAGVGYWLGGADGGVFAFNTPFFGNPMTGSDDICHGPTTNNPWICRGIAATHTGNGYWILSSETFEGGINGRVAAFGDASLPQMPAPLAGLNAPLVGLATTNDSGNGHGGLWLAGADGGVFAYGAAPYLGGMGGHPLAAPVVGIVSDPIATGYWLVGADGGIFAFGAAGFFGSTATSPLAHPVVGMASTPSGKGYWLVTSDGLVYPFGDAQYVGSVAGQPFLSMIGLRHPFVGMASMPFGQGYWLVANDGGVFAFGDAQFKGSMGGTLLEAPVMGIAVRSG